MNARVDECAGCVAQVCPFTDGGRGGLIESSSSVSDFTLAGPCSNAVSGKRARVPNRRIDQPTKTPTRRVKGTMLVDESRVRFLRRMDPIKTNAEEAEQRHAEQETARPKRKAKAEPAGPSEKKAKVEAAAAAGGAGPLAATGSRAAWPAG